MVTNLSGGEQRRVAIARVLLSQPDILLMDEPTNNLDAQSVAWLERTLAAFKGTVVAVTHDRFFLDNVAGIKQSADCHFCRKAGIYIQLSASGYTVDSRTYSVASALPAECHIWIRHER